jgi:hypothetical protein
VIIKYFEDGDPGGPYLASIPTKEEAKKYFDSWARCAITDPLITIESLVELWSKELENENRHSIVELPRQFVEGMRQAEVEDDKIKRTLWFMVGGD